VTGGSGIALALPENRGASGSAAQWHGEDGPAPALSGSCSTATRRQIAEHTESGGPPDHVRRGRLWNQCPIAA
jgi:uncharacterized protein YgbK (DUF1537 family)